MSRRYWYYYQSGVETDPSNYIALPFFECEGNGKTICAVYTRPNSIDPSLPNASELSGIFQSYIVQAKLISSFYPVSPQKPYVYLWTK